MAELISVIVPCYNQAQYLDECLQSVLEQTYPNWECIIVNDGSPDNTEEVAKHWTEKDSRFKYLKKENGGLSSARNAGIEVAQGEWIQFLDCDDKLNRNKFKESIEYTDNHTLVVTNFDMFCNEGVRLAFCDLTKKEINFKNVLEGWDVDFNIPIHSGLFKRDLIGETKFLEGIAAKEDWLFWLELLNKSEVHTIFIDKILVSYRDNNEGGSKSFKNVYSALREANNIIYRKYNDEAKEILFRKINNQNFELSNTSNNQKTYIRKLQATKVLKVYLKIRKMFTR